MDAELQRRIDQCRTDCEREINGLIEHFYCPILHIDERTQMCKGHVVQQSFGVSNTWLPQRKDIDNFYGTAVEAAFGSVIEDRGKNAYDVWVDPKLRRRHRPRIEAAGTPIEHYFDLPPRPVQGHTPVQLISESGEAVCDLMVKMSAEKIKTIGNGKIQLIVERDYRAPVVAALIKAAHLSLFKMLGYRHVFSATGLYLSNILAGFYRQHLAEKVRDEDVERYFRPLSAMISPMMASDPNVLQGTIADNRVFGCMMTSGGMFAVGVIIRVSDDEAFCVFAPTAEGITQGVYPGFLKEPPPSIAVRLMQFFPSDGEADAHWGTNEAEPMRIQMPDPWERPEFAAQRAKGRKLRLGNDSG